MPDTLALTPEEKSFFETRGGEAPDSGQKPEAIDAVEKPQTKADVTAQKDTVGGTDSTDKSDQGGTVPQKALHEERERRKAAQKEAEEARTNYAKLQSRLDTLQEIAKTAVNPQPKPAEPQIPDINVDPVGHFKAQTELLRKELDDTRKWRTEQEQRGEAVNNVQRIAQIAQAKEAEFIKTDAPDYSDASTHLRNLRDAQLIAYGVSDPMQRQNIIAQDAITIAANALSQNKNPAQVIYEMAKASGYAKKAMEQAKVADNTPSETDKVKMAAAGQKAGASLQQINGAASNITTIDALLKMDDEEFSAATKGDKWRKLLGG